MPSVLWLWMIIRLVENPAIHPKPDHRDILSIHQIQSTILFRLHYMKDNSLPWEEMELTMWHSTIGKNPISEFYMAILPLWIVMGGSISGIIHAIVGKGR